MKNFSQSIAVLNIVSSAFLFTASDVRANLNLLDIGDAEAVRPPASCTLENLEKQVETRYLKNIRAVFRIGVHSFKVELSTGQIFISNERNRLNSVKFPKSDKYTPLESLDESLQENLIKEYIALLRIYFRECLDHQQADF